MRRATSSPRPNTKHKARWWRTNEEAKKLSNEFPHGPITANNLTLVARIVCPTWGLAHDRRAVQRLARAGDVLIVKSDHCQQCQVFFRHQSLYEEANANLQALKNSHQRA